MMYSIPFILEIKGMEQLSAAEKVEAIKEILASLSTDEVIASFCDGSEVYEDELVVDTDYQDTTVSYVVSTIEENGDPGENLEVFTTLDEAIDYSGNSPVTAVYEEIFSVDRNISEYTMVWHPCGDCAEWPDCARDIISCPLSACTKPVDDDDFDILLIDEEEIL